MWLLMLGFFGLCVLPCGGLLCSHRGGDPTFQSYDSADGRFAANSPASRSPTPSPPRRAAPATAPSTSGAFPPETYFVHYLDLRAGPRASAQILKDAADKTVTQVPGSTEVRRTSGTTDGWPSVDLTVEASTRTTR